VNPQLVYIDNGEINFTITEKDMEVLIPISTGKNESQDNEVAPKLKGDKNVRKAN